MCSPIATAIFVSRLACFTCGRILVLLGRFTNWDRELCLNLQNLKNILSLTIIIVVIVIIIILENKIKEKLTLKKLINAYFHERREKIYGIVWKTNVYPLISNVSFDWHFYWMGKLRKIWKHILIMTNYHC